MDSGSIIPISIGSSAMLAFGIILWHKAHFLLTNGVRTRATVVGYQKVYSGTSRDIPTYAPVIEFTTNEGQHIVQPLNWSSDPPNYYKGKTISVLYDPTSPTTVDIDSIFKLVVLPWVIATLGVVGLVYSTVELVELYATP